MTEIHLVRHGQTEWSATGRHTSTTDLDLTAGGVEQAESLRSTLRPADYDLVLSSPRRRAVRTAELAGFADPELTEDLAEWAYGDYEGLTSDTIHQTVPGWTIWTGPTPGGESADAVRGRLARLLERIDRSGAQRAICFAHGHSLRALALTWLELDFALGERFPLETGSVSVLGRAKGEPALLRWNAT